MHFIAQRHVQSLYLAGDLGTDADLLLRLDGAIGQHRLFQLARLRHRSDITGSFFTALRSEVEK
ncbi:hypothetical protein D3C79_896010 [compost metagenome]